MESWEEFEKLKQKYQNLRKRHRNLLAEQDRQIEQIAQQDRAITALSAAADQVKASSRHSCRLMSTLLETFLPRFPNDQERLQGFIEHYRRLAEDDLPPVD